MLTSLCCCREPAVGGGGGGAELKHELYTFFVCDFLKLIMTCDCRELAGGGGGGGAERRKRSGLHQVQQGGEAEHDQHGDVGAAQPPHGRPHADEPIRRRRRVLDMGTWLPTLRGGQSSGILDWEVFVRG